MSQNFAASSSAVWRLLALSLIVGSIAPACVDLGSPGEPWQVDEAQEATADTGDPGADVGASIAATDVGVRRRDSVADAGTEEGDASQVDTGVVETSYRGIYMSGFETSLFVPDASLSVADWEDGCTSHLWQSAEDAGVERWWAEGVSRFDALTLFPPSSIGRVGVLEATGRLSEPGEYGHLGAYDRSFSVETSELDVCATFEALGHCVVPPDNAWCSSPLRLFDPYLIRQIPGVRSEDGRRFLELSAEDHDSDDLDPVIRLRLEVPAEGADLSIYDVDELPAISMVTEVWDDPGATFTFSDLRGWVGFDSTSRLGRNFTGTPQEWIWISVSGVDPNGQELHLWGHFTVDETIALP